jgi:hypothetical protein
LADKEMRLQNIIFFLFALGAMWFASVPQVTMLVAEPVYQRLAPESDAPGQKGVWIANVVWTPIAGAALSTSVRHGWPKIFTGIFGFWAFLGAPIAGAVLATWAFGITLSKDFSRRSQMCARLGLVFWIVSLFLIFRIPLGVPVEFGFWWSTY